MIFKSPTKGSKKEKKVGNGGRKIKKIKRKPKEEYLSNLLKPLDKDVIGQMDEEQKQKYRESLSAKKNPKPKKIKNQEDFEENLKNIRLVSDQEKADKMKRAKIWKDKDPSLEAKRAKKCPGFNLKIVEPKLVESLSPIKNDEKDENDEEISGPKNTRMVTIENNTDEQNADS